jgi:hypothetical protein
MMPLTQDRAVFRPPDQYPNSVQFRSQASDLSSFYLKVKAKGQLYGSGMAGEGTHLLMSDER